MVKDLDFEGIKFPVFKNNYSKIKQKNNLCINVFSYENDLVYPADVSNKKFENLMDLFMIINEYKSHYVYIKDFNRCMYNKTRNNHTSTVANIVYNVLVLEKTCEGIKKLVSK